MSNTVKQIPEGYRPDAQGRLVPEQNIPQVDLLRDELVARMATDAVALRRALTDFKRKAEADIISFIELALSDYGVEHGGAKGNVTLMSFDGRYKVLVQVSEFIAFDERLNAAKSLIDECLIEWSKGANANLKTLVQDAFQVDKQGRYNRGRILGLRRLEINDDRWNRAMDAIADSMQVLSTKQYVRFFERDEKGKYTPISLDFASL